MRAYNRAWDFFSGMTQREIEAYLREDVTWHRPTWPLGNARPQPGAWRWQDPYELFINGGGTNGTHGASEWDRRRPARPHRAHARGARPARRTSPVQELKARYKQLAKRHHPDLHGGDKKAEERLKLINEAYTYLMDSERFG